MRVALPNAAHNTYNQGDRPARAVFAASAPSEYKQAIILFKIHKHLVEHTDKNVACNVQPLVAPGEESVRTSLRNAYYY